MRSIIFVLSGLIITCIVYASDAIGSKDIGWFLSNSGLKGRLEESSLRDATVVNQIRDAGGIFVLRAEISEQQGWALLRDNFFNWWFDGPIKEDILKKTYGLLDPGDKVFSEKRMIPEGKKCWWIFISSGVKQRLYVIDATGSKWVFYYLYSEI